MANRSDFLSVLPRQYKKLIGMGVARGFIQPSHAGEVRRLFVAAHRTHKSFKLNRKVDPVIKEAIKADAAAEAAGEAA